MECIVIKRVSNVFFLSVMTSDGHRLFGDHFIRWYGVDCPIPVRLTKRSRSCLPGRLIDCVSCGNLLCAGPQNLLKRGNIRAMPSGEENRTVSTVSTPSRVRDTSHAIPRDIRQAVNAPDLEERLESGLRLFRIHKLESLDVEREILVMLDERSDFEAVWSTSTRTRNDEARHDRQV